MPEQFKLEKLKDMYRKGKEVDKIVHSEQRTNIMLKMGDHYKKRTNSLFEDMRSKDVQGKQQKIRLTKNHIHRITNEYENSILSTNPSTTAVPYNESELHDVKNAQLNNAVLAWIKDTNSWDTGRQGKAVHDFIVIGEVWAKVSFDYSKGSVVGMSGEEGDEDRQEQRAGEIVIDRIFGFDLKRDPSARSEDEVKWYMHEQMMDIKEFKQTMGDSNKEAMSKITPELVGTIKIFDPNTGAYRVSKEQVLIKELFIKPSILYPRGWYVMFTDQALIMQQELPFGIYPIIGGGFDELTTSPRSSSIIKVCRPYQVEVNRASSKMAEHQITLGDDKVFIQKGTKLSAGGYFHGVRSFTVSGKEPMIQPGRSGAQYLEYGLSQVTEMYEAVNLAHIREDKNAKVGDPFQLLFVTMKDKKRFTKYVEKYSQFEIKLFKLGLEMSKRYLSEKHMILIAGKDEQVNISEFKSSKEIGFEIKVVPQSGDVEEKFGKLIATTQALQYAGSSLTPDQIGNLLRNMPFGNKEQMFSTLTSNQDNAVNDILALDRGVSIEAKEFEDHGYMINALMHRMKKSDFQFLDENIKGNYTFKLAQHENFFNEEKQALLTESTGLIPAGGFLTTVNASWNNPVTDRVERIKIPSESIQWLVSKLQAQGAFTKELEELPNKARLDMANNGIVQAPQLQGLPQPQAAPTGSQAQNIGV